MFKFDPLTGSLVPVNKSSGQTNYLFKSSDGSIIIKQNNNSVDFLINSNSLPKQLPNIQATAPSITTEVHHHTTETQLQPVIQQVENTYNDNDLKEHLNGVTTSLNGLYNNHANLAESNSELKREIFYLKNHNYDLDEQYKKLQEHHNYLKESLHTDMMDYSNIYKVQIENLEKSLSKHKQNLKYYAIASGLAIGVLTLLFLLK